VLAFCKCKWVQACCISDRYLPAYVANPKRTPTHAQRTRSHRPHHTRHTLTSLSSPVVTSTLSSLLANAVELQQPSCARKATAGVVGTDLCETGAHRSTMLANAIPGVTQQHSAAVGGDGEQRLLAAASDVRRHESARAVRLVIACRTRTRKITTIRARTCCHWPRLRTDQSVRRCCCLAVHHSVASTPTRLR
jgi:hypothetical protein